jgi:hypothetical protein
MHRLQVLTERVPTQAATGDVLVEIGHGVTLLVAILFVVLRSGLGGSRDQTEALLVVAILSCLVGLRRSSDRSAVVPS